MLQGELQQQRVTDQPLEVLSPREQRQQAEAERLAAEREAAKHASAPAFLAGLHPARHAQLRQECLGLVAPEYVALEAGLDAEATWLQRAAEGVRASSINDSPSAGLTSSPSWRRARPR